MGKFYLENKHIWFRHRAELAHKARMEERDCFAATAEVSTEFRFFYELNGEPPPTLRLLDHGQENIAVVTGNVLVGYLDPESSAEYRQYVKENPALEHGCPAKLAGQEPISGAYLVRLGFK